MAKATIKGKDSIWFRFAAITQEVVMGFNIVITILFWVVLAPLVFKDLSWHGYDLFLRSRMTFLHIMPLVSSIVNLVMTDMRFLKKDWKYVFMCGVLYIPANGLGTWVAGHPLYPIVDWKNPLETVILFLI